MTKTVKVGDSKEVSPFAVREGERGNPALNGVSSLSLENKAFFKEVFMEHKKRGAALITAALVALIALFGMTACPNAAGGGGGNIEGVWKTVSSKQNDEAPTQFPVTQPDNSTTQLYLCFSEGKAYSANKIEGKANSAENGLFKGELWEEPYVFANGTLAVGDVFISFTIIGNAATMTMTDEGDTIVIQLTQVSAPTVAEIKAANEP